MFKTFFIYLFIYFFFFLKHLVLRLIFGVYSAGGGWCSWVFAGVMLHSARVSGGLLLRFAFCVCVCVCAGGGYSLVGGLSLFQTVMELLGCV